MTTMSVIWHGLSIGMSATSRQRFTIWFSANQSLINRHAGLGFQTLTNSSRYHHRGRLWRLLYHGIGHLAGLDIYEEPYFSQTLQKLLRQYGLNRWTRYLYRSGKYGVVSRMIFWLPEMVRIIDPSSKRVDSYLRVKQSMIDLNLKVYTERRNGRWGYHRDTDDYRKAVWRHYCYQQSWSWRPRLSSFHCLLWS